LAADDHISRGEEAGPKSVRSVKVLPEPMAIARLAADAVSPKWAEQAGFSCVFRTDDSLTVICAQAFIPEDVRSDRDWLCLEVEGPLDLSLTGVLASLTGPLAQAGIPVFALSSFETDFILVREEHLSPARLALERAGYLVLDG
jgi:hypothetical protein